MTYESAVMRTPSPPTSRWESTTYADSIEATHEFTPDLTLGLCLTMSATSLCGSLGAKDIGSPTCTASL